MCNLLHEETAQKIKETGYGYKIFDVVDSQSNYGAYYGMCTYDYKLKVGDTIEWDQERFPSDADKTGFCFIPTKKEATDLFRAWYKKCSSWQTSELVLCRIKYEQGLGRCKDFITIGESTWNIGICRKFTIIEEIKRESARR
ncbi:hypothetical protein KO465_04925 [Candidatus Micrarchaeota archaeon]|nr:hypothetical protein [Candidatus Micrarchaeota archaeon]